MRTHNICFHGEIRKISILLGSSLARVTWESHVLLLDGQAVFPGFSGLRPPLMDDRLDISEIFL